MKENERLVITLVAPASTTARAMANELGIKTPELVRRGLSLMRLWMSLKHDEALLVRRADGTFERLVLWPMLEQM